MMFEQKTLLGMMERSGKAKVNMRLSTKLSGGIDDESKEEIESVLQTIDEAGKNILGHVEEYSEVEIERLINNPNITGQDIATVLLNLDLLMSEPNKAIQSLKTELDFLELSYRDEYNKFYGEKYDGTVNDRTSHAESKTTAERYTIFVKRALYDSLVSRRDDIVRRYKSLERLSWKHIQAEQ